MGVRTREWVDVDLFAGPGGWDTGLAMLGVASPVGVEWDPAACATARAAGYVRLSANDEGCADVAAVDPIEAAAGRTVRLLIASPPCQAWSRAGKRGGIKDQPRIWDHLEVVQHAGRWVDYSREGWHDDRSPLVLELVRWVDALRPEAIAAEQVPDVLPFWEAVCRWLRTLGYSATCGLLSAERYGVPQTRQRAILVARRDGQSARLPKPTHARYVASRGSDAQVDGLFDAPERERAVLPADRHLLPWVSMAEALGWGMTERPGLTFTPGGGGNPDNIGRNAGAGRAIAREQSAGRWAGSGHDRPAPAPTLTTSMDGWTLRQGDRANGTTRNTDEPAPTVLCSRTTNLSWALRNGTQDNACIRTLAEPAGTVFFSQRGNAVDWVADRPATTVQGDPRVAGPGHRDREGGERQFDGEEVVRITIEQAGILQSFPPNYPWQGTKTAQFRQVGDAVPPLLAAAVAGEVLGIDWRAWLWPDLTPARAA